MFKFQTDSDGNLVLREGYPELVSPQYSGPCRRLKPCEYVSQVRFYTKRECIVRILVLYGEAYMDV